MVDLGQKGWKQFHLFYYYKVKKKIDKQEAPISNFEIGASYFKMKDKSF